jgi:hypothetical protein
MPAATAVTTQDGGTDGRIAFEHDADATISARATVATVPAVCEAVDVAVKRRAAVAPMPAATAGPADRRLCDDGETSIPIGENVVTRVAAAAAATRLPRDTVATTVLPRNAVRAILT